MSFPLHIVSSLLRTLLQTFRLIVVSDASGDRSPLLVQLCGVRLLPFEPSDEKHQLPQKKVQHRQHGQSQHFKKKLVQASKLVSECGLHTFSSRRTHASTLAFSFFTDLMQPFGIDMALQPLGLPGPFVHTFWTRVMAFLSLAHRNPTDTIVATLVPMSVPSSQPIAWFALSIQVTSYSW